MIFLITGASHTGKTLFAQRLLETYKIPYFSIDHLKMGLIRSGQTALTPEDDDELTAYLWPIVREMLRTAIENEQSLTVEGCYVPAGWREDLGKAYAKHVRFYCLAMTDAYIDAHFEEIKAHASEIEKRLDDSDCTPERLKADNRAVRARFGNREGFVPIDGDYEKTLRSLL